MMPFPEKNPDMSLYLNNHISLLIPEVPVTTVFSIHAIYQAIQRLQVYLSFTLLLSLSHFYTCKFWSFNKQILVHSDDKMNLYFCIYERKHHITKESYADHSIVPPSQSKTHIHTLALSQTMYTPHKALIKNSASCSDYGWHK